MGRAVRQRENFAGRDVAYRTVGHLEDNLGGRGTQQNGLQIHS